jgi:UDP-glucose 4-epimerase
MRVLMFGGGGFIGSTIADRLLAAGVSVRIFERPRVLPYREFSSEESVEWLSGDLSSAQDVSNAVSGVDAVLHLVSTTLPKGSNDDPVYDVQSNVVPSLHILNAMVRHGVRRIVFISSGGTVYGDPQYLPIDEKHATNPAVSYGITKLAIEKYMHLYEKLHGVTAITLRVANPYGERQRIETAQGAVGVFLYRALKQIPIEIWGDGSVTRDYLHVTDVAEAFFAALNYNGKERLFNISSGAGTSLNGLLDMLELTLERKVVRSYLAGRAFDVPVSVLSNQLAQRELNWTPSILLKDGLARTADWMKRELARTHPQS